MTNSYTLGKIIHALSVRTSFTKGKSIVLLDAGIAKEDNLKLLRKNHFKYLFVSRPAKSRYKVNKDSKSVTIIDKRKVHYTSENNY